jgi:pimeloyl-ACP methyl ester carboxylesterase
MTVTPAGVVSKAPGGGHGTASRDYPGQSAQPLDGPTGRLVSTWAPVQGLKVHALVSVHEVPSAAPTVVLIHGVAVSSRYLVPFAERLAPYARVYVPDLPGYGRSDRPPGHDLTVPELADAVLTWMDRVGLDRPHLFGNSFGCQVIADLAARHPDRVGHLVLQGPTMDPRARSAWQQILRCLAVMPFERYSEGPVLLLDLWNLGMRRAIDMLRIALHDPIEQKLSRIRAPTLVVRGGRDAIVPQRWAEEAACLLPDGRLIVIERAAHTINYSQPSWLLDVVWPFFAGSDGASGDSGRASTPQHGC